MLGFRVSVCPCVARCPVFHVICHAWYSCASPDLWSRAAGRPPAAAARLLPLCTQREHQGRTQEGHGKVSWLSFKTDKQRREQQLWATVEVPPPWAPPQTCRGEKGAGRVHGRGGRPHAIRSPSHRVLKIPAPLRRKFFPDGEDWCVESVGMPASILSLMGKSGTRLSTTQGDSVRSSCTGV